MNLSPYNYNHQKIVFEQTLTQTSSGTLQSEDWHHELQRQGVQNDVRKEGHGTSRHRGVAVHAEVARLAVGLGGFFWRCRKPGL